MPQPVKVGDALIEAARTAAEENHRSMAAQIEHWALLGRAVEKALTLGDTQALKRSEGQLDSSARGRIAEALTNALDPDRSAIAKTTIGLRDANPLRDRSSAAWTSHSAAPRRNPPRRPYGESGIYCRRVSR